MDFRLTKEQADIQKAAVEFAEGEFDPDLALEWDRDQHFPKTLWERASDFGAPGPRLDMQTQFETVVAPGVPAADIVHNSR